MISLSRPAAHSLASMPTLPVNFSSCQDLNLNALSLTARMLMFHSVNVKCSTLSINFRFFRFSASVSSGGFWFTRSNSVISAFNLLVTSAPADWMPVLMLPGSAAACAVTSLSCLSISA